MILEVKNISKKFGGLQAVNNVSIEIEKGKITALIGPNGAGKTTLFNIISGVIKPDQGSILFFKKDITKLPIHKRAQNGLSRTFQMTRNFKNMSIRDNLLLVKDGSDAEFTKQLSRVGLHKSLDTLAGDLSYGQQRLLELVRALLVPHSLLMLDEPTAGVNPAIRKEMKTILKELREKGQTVLLIEHDMDFVMDVSDIIIVLTEGSFLMQGTPTEVKQNPKVLEAYLGK